VIEPGDDVADFTALMHCGVAFPTVIGDIAYDAKRDRATVDYVWGVWKKGDDGKIKFKPM